jgi:hypothetical protein
MRDDLLEAYAAADWAISHLEGFQRRLKTWIDHPPYSLVEEPHPEMGKKLFKLRVDSPLPATFNAEVGAIINTIRTSLDLLASALARRNGKKPSADRHFPIYPSLYDFIDPLNVAKRKDWLSERERSLIEKLKPYRGGNDRLFALHHFDVTRKHERLIEVRIVPTAISVSPVAYAQGLEFRPVWPGFQDDAVIAWTGIDATNSEFQMALDVTFNEGDLVANEPVGQALRDFWRLATMIIEMFGKDS